MFPLWEMQVLCNRGNLHFSCCLTRPGIFVLFCFGIQFLLIWYSVCDLDFITDGSFRFEIMLLMAVIVNYSCNAIQIF